MHNLLAEDDRLGSVSQEGVAELLDHGRIGGHLVDGGRDLAIGRRDQLDAVTQVQLVPVVLRRVVARGDHHAGVGAQVENGGGQHGRRQGTRQHLGPPAERTDHGCNVRGELGRSVTGVVSDDHERWMAVSQIGSCKPAHESCGCLPDDAAVHAIRPRAQRGAQARGAERQTTGEQFGQLRAVGREETFDFGSVLGLRVGFGPQASARSSR